MVRLVGTTSLLLSRGSQTTRLWSTSQTPPVGRSTPLIDLVLVWLRPLPRPLHTLRIWMGSTIVRWRQHIERAVPSCQHHLPKRYHNWRWCKFLVHANYPCYAANFYLCSFDAKHLRETQRYFAPTNAHNWSKSRWLLSFCLSVESVEESFQDMLHCNVIPNCCLLVWVLE